jgi:hypothetical protein
MITESKYLEAIETIKVYQKQINNQVNEILNNGINLTPQELFNTWQTYFPKMNNRLWLLLLRNFRNTKLIDIDKATFLKSKGCGIRSYQEFKEIVGIF